MASSWQEHFFEKLVAACAAADDERLSTAQLHRRKKTVSFQHSQLRQVGCAFGTSRTIGSQAQMLLIECLPKRATEMDVPALKRQMDESGIGGNMHMDHDTLFFQYQWGFGYDTSFPIHDARRVSELSDWAIGTFTLLFDHMEQRRHVVTASMAHAMDAKPSLNLRVALERYLEDLLIQDWDRLPWATELEYLDRQVECGTLGRIDILARDQNTGDYVIIELKRDRSDDEVVGQCSRYMGWIKQYWAEPAGVGVRGIIVAHEATDRLQAAVLPHESVSVYTYQLSVALTPVTTELNTMR
jgi:hypothetical protein